MMTRSLLGGGGALLLACLSSGVVGCARGPALAPVEGTVKQNGVPLANVLVEFWPEAGSPRSTGVTDDKGRFVLKTDGSSSRPGAVGGAHKVVLRDLKVYEGLPMRPRDDEDIRERPARFAQQYADAQLSPLRYTVETKKDNNFAITVAAGR